VTALNDRLASSPELVNQDPYGEGWMIEIHMSDPSQIGALLTAEAYQAQLPSE
jgi:glycine cleavage system H protein